MTHHYFEHNLVKLSYYKFGQGPKAMLCFHGYGMHGRQFLPLQQVMGQRYTFYSFDLFFHERTQLKEKHLKHVKRGISTQELCQIILDFLKKEEINRFSVIGYSMGSHYAAAIASQLAIRIDEWVVIAPMFLKPPFILEFFTRNPFGNRLFGWLLLKKTVAEGILKFARRSRLFDQTIYEVLHKEIATPELRFMMFASLTYIKNLRFNQNELAEMLNNGGVKNYFIFGTKDKLFPPAIATAIMNSLVKKEYICLEENHDMVNQNLAETLFSKL
jgi:pimeloyl-ACP methyl ester carboxylesterase